MQQSLFLTQRTCSCSGAFGSRGPRQQQQQRAIARAHGTQQCSTSSSSSDGSPAAGSLLLGAAAAAMALQVCLPALAALPDAAAPAAAASSSNSSSSGRLQQPWQPVLGDMSLTAAAAPGLQQQDEEDQYDDELTAQVALPPELMQFMQLTQKGEVKDVRRLQEARRSVGFERSLDGRVFLLSEDGEPFQVKADMGVPGLLLLRDAGGYCYFIPPPEDNRLVQIDLSDDAIVAQLFANHAWEELVEPLEVQEEGRASSAAAPGPGGRLQQLRLTERQFRSVVSLATGAQELPEEPLEDLDALEQQN